MSIREPRTEYTYPLFIRDYKEPLFSMNFLNQRFLFKEVESHHDYRYYITSNKYIYVSKAIPIDYHDYVFDTKGCECILRHLKDRFFIVNVVDKRLKLLKDQSLITKYYNNMKIAKQKGYKHLESVMSIDY